MIRFAVALLVCLQALVPSGVCPCTLVPGEPAPLSAPLPDPAETVATITAKPPQCPCEARREAARLLDPAHTDDHDTDTEHDDQNHTPPCPVLVAGGDTHVALPPAREFSALDVLPPVVALVEQIAPAHAEPPTLRLAPSLSLFVRHCAYLL